VVDGTKYRRLAFPIITFVACLTSFVLCLTYISPVTQPSSPPLLLQYHREQLTTLFSPWIASTTTSSSSSSSPSISQLPMLLCEGSTSSPVVPNGKNTTNLSIYSMNSELERLLGYTQEEWRLQLQSVGWKTDFRFAYPEEASLFIQYSHHYNVGIITQFSMVAHILTKVTFA
jgi:hypothetical protein